MADKKSKIEEIDERIKAANNELVLINAKLAELKAEKALEIARDATAALKSN